MAMTVKSSEEMKKPKIKADIRKHLQLMQVLGSTEDTAKKAIEKIEALGDKDKIAKGYETAYKSLLKKKPEVEIEVYPDGKYSRAEFTDGRVAMPHDDNRSQVSADITPEDINDETDLSLEDLPF